MWRGRGGWGGRASSVADVESDAGERGSTGCTGLVFSQIQLSHGVRIQLRDYSLHHRKITEGEKSEKTDDF